MSSKLIAHCRTEVAAWHIADIDKTIDGLGLNTDGYDRDGLRAVAHLGGKHGMKKFVQSAGKYNPSDETRHFICRIITMSLRCSREA